MDYKRIYDELIQSRLILKEERIELRKCGEYFEAHHIIPHSMGGGGKRNGWKDLNHPNIIILTAREHYIAHLLLWMTYKTREMAYSFRIMCTIKNHGKREYKVSSRIYEDLRIYINKIGVSEEVKERLRKHNMGKKLSPEHREKIRQANLGKKLSPEAKEKLRIYRTGMKMPPEAIEKTRQANLKKRWANLGKPHKKMSEESREKIRQSRLGKKVSKETKEKISKTKRKNRLLGLTPKQVMSPESIAKRQETRKRNRLLKELKSTEESFGKHFDGGQGG